MGQEAISQGQAPAGIGYPGGVEYPSGLAPSGSCEAASGTKGLGGLNATRLALAKTGVCQGRTRDVSSTLGFPKAGQGPLHLRRHCCRSRSKCRDPSVPTWHETQEQEQAGAVPCHDAAAVPGGEEEREQRRLRGDKAAGRAGLLLHAGPGCSSLWGGCLWDD